METFHAGRRNLTADEIAALCEKHAAKAVVEAAKRKEERIGRPKKNAADSAAFSTESKEAPEAVQDAVESETGVRPTRRQAREACQRVRGGDAKKPAAKPTRIAPVQAVAARAKDQYAKQAKERQVESGKHHGKGVKNSAQSIADSGKSRDKAGQAVGVSGYSFLVQIPVIHQIGLNSGESYRNQRHWLQTRLQLFRV